MYPSFEEDEFKGSCALLFLVAWTVTICALLFTQSGLPGMLGWRFVGLLFLGVSSASAIGSIFSRLLVSTIDEFKPEFWREGLGIVSTAIFSIVQISFAIAAACGVFELTHP